jgi:hypothetical protein
VPKTKLLPLELYNDLCKEIDCLYIRIRQLETERDYYWQMGTHPTKAMMPLDRSLDEMYRVDDVLIPLNQIMNDKEQTKREIEKKMSEFNGIEYKVAYRRLQGYSLVEIAAELGYSPDWIKHVSARIGNGLFRRVSKDFRTTTTPRRHF